MLCQPHIVISILSAIFVHICGYCFPVAQQNKYVFLPGDRHLMPIGVKIYTMIDLCPILGFLHFYGNIF